MTTLWGWRDSSKLFNQVSHHMRSCLHGHSTLQSILRSCPSSTHPPEPMDESMYMDVQLTPAECLLCLTNLLYLYCEAGEHIIAECPVRPPCPMVSPINCSLVIHSPLHNKVSYLWLYLLNSNGPVRVQLCR